MKGHNKLRFMMILQYCKTLSMICSVMLSSVHYLCGSKEQQSRYTQLLRIPDWSCHLFRGTVLFLFSLLLRHKDAFTSFRRWPKRTKQSCPHSCSLQSNAHGCINPLGQVLHTRHPPNGPRQDHRQTLLHPLLRAPKPVMQ